MSQRVTPVAMYEEARAQKRGHPLLSLVIILEALAVLAVALAPVGYDYMYRDRVFPGVSALTLDLGGLTPDQARALLSQPIAEREGKMLTLRYGERVWTATAAELGLRYNLEATVGQAFALGRGHGFLADTGRRLDLLRQGQIVTPTLDVDRVRSLDFMQRLAREVDVTMLNATLGIENLQVATSPARTGYRLDIETSAARIVDALRDGRGGEVTLVVAVQKPQVSDAGIAEARVTLQRLIAAPISLAFRATDWTLQSGAAQPKAVERNWTIERAQLAAAVVFDQRRSGDEVTLAARLDGEKFRKLFSDIAKELNRDAQDARFAFDEKTARLTPLLVSKEGRTVDVAENIKRVVAAAGSENRSLQLAVTINKPAVAVDQADKLGIRELAAERGVTTFAGSSAARTHNIRLAADKMSGVVIPPGATFSLLDALGPITAEAGYEPGFAIIGDYTVQDIGGGVCQVATTAFRAAFWAGLPMIERNPHRYKIDRYFIKGGPLGLDAAIYDPGRDLQFKNTTNSYLLIQADASDPSNFTVSLYGAKLTWTVTLENVSSKPGQKAGPRLPDVQDATMAAGTRVLAQPAVDGVSASFTRVVRQGASIVSSDTFNTNYQPAAEQWVVGTKR